MELWSTWLPLAQVFHKSVDSSFHWLNEGKIQKPLPSSATIRLIFICELKEVELMRVRAIFSVPVITAATWRTTPPPQWMWHSRCLALDLHSSSYQLIVRTASGDNQMKKEKETSPRVSFTPSLPQTCVLLLLPFHSQCSTHKIIPCKWWQNLNTKESELWKRFRSGFLIGGM